jgi:acetyl-CoA synthetase
MTSRYPAIAKPGLYPITPNLMDYEQTRSVFTWKEAESYLTMLPNGAWNIAYEAIDRHVAGGEGDRVALVWLGRRGDKREYSYAELAEATSRFASGLAGLGVGRGDRVFILSPRIPEMYVATLGALKNGSAVSPLFSAFGPEPILTRLAMGEGKVLVTTDSLYRRKVAGIRDQVPGLEHVIVVGEPIEGTLSFDAMLKAGDPSTPCQPMGPEDMALLHFTSGTTGAPKGAVHVHRAVLHHYVSALYALDLHPEDV